MQSAYIESQQNPKFQNGNIDVNIVNEILPPDPPQSKLIPAN